MGGSCDSWTASCVLVHKTQRGVRKLSTHDCLHSRHVVANSSFLLPGPHASRSVGGLGGCERGRSPAFMSGWPWQRLLSSVWSERP